MIERLKKMVESEEARLNGLVARSDKSENIAELRSLTADITAARDNIAELRAALADAEAAEARAKNPIPAGGIPAPQAQGTYSAYEIAFKDFVQKRKPIPQELLTSEMRSALSAIQQAEGRAAGTTISSEVSALIPVTVMNEVIRTKAPGVYGQLFNRVRHTNIPGGVRYPVSSMEATFNWLTEGTCPTGDKAGNANTYIEFGSYLGVAQINVSMIVSVEAVSAFYAELTQLIREAFYRAMDTAIVKGSGEGQPRGITTDPSVTNTVSFSAAEIGDWNAWMEKLISAIPLGKRNREDGYIVLGAGTIDRYIRTMHDDNNRPFFFDTTMGLGGGFSGGGIEGRFLGERVLAVENELLPSFDTASANDVIGFFAPLRDYSINSNLQIAVSTFRDEKCLQDVTRGLVICDGKPLDTSGMILIKKSA